MEDLSPEPIALGAWLEIVTSEYLAEFVPAGGAALRIAVMEETLIAPAIARLGGLARRHQLLPVAIDAADTRLHMPQDLFFALARAMDWTALAQSFLEKLFAANAYAWPHPSRKLSRAALAEALAIAPPLLDHQINAWLTRAIWQNRAYALDFRVGMLKLCDAALDPDPDAAAPVHQWLHGEKPSAVQLRAAGIGGRITRANARAMLISLCHWVRACGAAGLLVTLDARRLHLPRPALEDGLRYSPAAVMDTFEVLRELIDDAEHLPGLFAVVLDTEALIAGEPRRTLDSYDALRMRVWPDVRPGMGQNPVAPLVWLAA
ncbi:MAG: DUF2791 family P-loop domain-containing protein [Rhodospirillales bacterium]|nr:DUF2791 family P-loop domain-containing protein [Rhodospirillales bacterium]